MSQSRAVEDAVQARRLGKRFGRHWALAHVDVTIGCGEAVLLAGANGSGKTTLLRLFCGLHKPTRGSIHIFGRDAVQERLTCRRDLAVVSHHSYLYDRLTAGETVRLWGRLLGRTVDETELNSLLEEVGLERRSGVPVGGFSAGMRKRLTLLLARLQNPRLVLFDEPFSALDIQGQALVERWIEAFRSEGKTVILASHDLPRAARLCTNAIVLRSGQLAWTGAAGDVLENY